MSKTKLLDFLNKNKPLLVLGLAVGVFSCFPETAFAIKEDGLKTGVEKMVGYLQGNIAHLGILLGITCAGLRSYFTNDGGKSVGLGVLTGVGMEAAIIGLKVVYPVLV